MSLPDITRNRHRGNPHSEAANRRLHPHKPLQRESVLALITFMGAYGATCEEVATVLKMRVHSISARLAELKADGLVKETGETRKTEGGFEAAVIVATGKNDAMPAETTNAPLNADAAIQKELFT